MAVTANFTYVDAEGHPIARIDRVEPGHDGKSKEFLPYLSDADGGFHSKSGLGDVRLPLYHRDEVLGSTSGIAFLVEGEGKCDVLRAALRGENISAVVTTISNGASAPLRPEHVADFAHLRRLIVLPDADDPGRGAATTRAQRIADANPALDVRILDLYPDASDHRDVADWLAEGHTIEELRELVVKAARVTSREPTMASPQTTDALSFQDLVAKCDEVVDWAIDGLLRRSGIMLLAAQPKVGKSDLARNLARAVASGTMFLGRQCHQGRVLFLELEESASYLRERLELMQMGDLDIAYVVERPVGDESAWLRSMIQRHRPAVCIIDTIGRFSNIENICDYSQVKRATQPLLDLRTEFGVSFCVLHHSNRGNGVLGSTMWNGTADTILSLSRAEDHARFAEADGRGITMERTLLAFDRETGMITAAEPAYVAERRIAEHRVLAMLGKTQAASREDLARGCGRKASVGRSAVDALVAAGLLQKAGDGTRKSPRLYSLAEAPHSSSRESVYYMDEDPEVPDPPLDELPDAGRSTPTNPEVPEVPEGDDLLKYAHEVGL